MQVLILDCLTAPQHGDFVDHVVVCGSMSAVMSVSRGTAVASLVQSCLTMSGTRPAVTVPLSVRSISPSALTAHHTCLIVSACSLHNAATLLLLLMNYRQT